MNPLLFLILALLPVVPLVIINVVIHELGHMAAGLMSGYAFLSFRLGPFVWTKTDGKVSYSFSPSALIAGQCLMAPPKDEKDFKFIFYNLGGGIANLLLAILLIGVAVAVPSGIELFSFLFASITASLLMGLLNLIPFSASVPNDGYNVLSASRSEDAKHGFYRMLRANHEVVLGKRYREFSSEDFFVPGTADTGNIFVANLCILEAARLFDLGLYDQSLAVYNRLNIDRLPMYYRNSINIDFLYYYTVLRPDPGMARLIRSQKNMTRILNMGNPSCTRVNAAYEYFIGGNRQKGLQLLNTAKKQQSTYPSKGVALMEGEYITALEKSFM